MAKIAYIGKRFRADTMTIIEQANSIIAEYTADGFDLTVRQLFYQFVARGLIANTEASYDKIKAVVNDARMAGLIDWNTIVDRTRNLQVNSHWNSPEDIIRAAANSYRVDKWENQPYRVEVWIEKEALAGVLEAVCPGLDISYFSCRGYVSQSEQWRAGMRLLGYQQAGQTPVVIHLGDHDPSGIDMTRDIADRLHIFGVTGPVVERIALNMPQVEEQQPPPNPAKTTDSRFAGYRSEFGEESWELDALNPQYLTRIITEKVLSYRDEDLWQEAVDRETEERERLADLPALWSEKT